MNTWAGAELGSALAEDRHLADRETASAYQSGVHADFGCFRHMALHASVISSASSRVA